MSFRLGLTSSCNVVWLLQEDNVSLVKSLWEKVLDTCKIQILFGNKDWNFVLIQGPYRLHENDSGFFWKKKVWSGT